MILLGTHWPFPAKSKRLHPGDLAFANWLGVRAEEKKKLWGGASGDLEVNILGVGNSQWKQTFQHFPR